MTIIFSSGIPFLWRIW